MTNVRKRSKTAGFTLKKKNNNLGKMKFNINFINKPVNI